MSEDIRDLLGEAIRTELWNLSDLTPGSKEKSTAVEDLAKLYRLRIEELKNDGDLNEKHYNRECEERLKKDQLNEQVKDRYFRLGVEASGIVLPLIFYAAWMRRGFKFEENGTFTSKTFIGLINRFKPTKK